MFHITVSNLILIQFLLCSILNLIHQGDSAFKLVTSEESTKIKLRLWYKNYRYRVFLIKYWYDNNSSDPEIHEIQMNTKEDDYLIKNLEPCTTYTIRTELRKYDITEFGQTISKTTHYAQPISEISNVIPSIDSANVSFKYVNYNCIDSIKLFLNYEEIASFDKSNLPDSYLVERLAPCTSYSISIKNNSFINSNTKEFTTNSVEEYPIEDLEFDSKTELLIWKRYDFGRMCIKNYVINIESDFGGSSNSSDSESYSLTSQPGCSNFTINIISQGLNGKVLGSVEINDIRTGFKMPSSIESLIAINSTSNSITINWNSPNINPRCVKNYEIKFNGQYKYTTSTTYTLQHLEPCEYYDIEVCVVTITDDPTSCNKIRLNTLGIPGKVEELQHLIYRNFKWKPPNYGARCIERYEINVTETTGIPIYKTSVTSLVTNFQIDTSQLKSCQNYLISVTPVTSSGTAGPPEFIMITTRPERPSPPTAPLLITKSSTLLELKSEYNEDNVCPLREAMFKCQEADTHIVHWENMTLTENERVFTGNVSDLKDFTTYKCSAYVKNDNDDLSDASEQGVFETDEKVSDPPEITIGLIKFDSFTFSWLNLISRIKIKRYHVIVSTLGKNYTMPEGCEDTRNISYIVIEPNLLKYEIINLEPHTKYSVEMAIENTAGTGNYSEPVEVITEPYISHQVTHFKIAKVNVNQTVELMWNLPCEINGELVSMTGQLYENFPVEKTIDWKSPMENDILPKTYTINYVLKPVYNYTITIGIELLNFNGSLNLTSMSFTTPPGIPDAYNSSDWGEIVQETSPINNINLTINKNLFSSTKGKILKFTFLISERYCEKDDPKPSQMYFLTGNDYVNLPTWYDVVDEQCTNQYQLEEYLNNYNFDEVDSFQFIIGNESCVKENRGDSQFCNGPLKAGTDYAVMARVFTSNGYADTQAIIFMTEANFSALMVIFIILSILLTGFFIGIGFMRYKSKRLSVPLSSTDIAVKSYMTYYSQMEFDLIVKEYESIETLDLQEYTTIEAKKYKEKNRYANILPYDQNRVIITPNTYCTSDYINASYIDGYKRKQEYIASQGPKPETCYDFWDMVIETKCHKIVMLTKLVENGITKCFQYYPDSEAELQFNDIKITNIKEDNLEIFTRRELKITKGMAKRLILQYHFQKWPDHDCPENEMDLIKFIQFLKSDNSSSHPIVVHCSAGVGRTGTLISLDMLMQQVQNKKYLNVYETVKKLRYQRVKMVQTFEQYEFLYKSIAKYVQWRWPANKS